MNTIELKHISCPLCASDSHEEVYKYELKVNLKGAAVLWPARQVVCCDCGMVFTNPQPTDAVLEEFYRSYVMFGGVTSDKRLRVQQIDFIEREVGKRPCRWFDVGANNGAFLHFARERGHSVSGIEPSRDAVRESREAFGIQLHEGFLTSEFVESLAEKFDVVSINHVLEHVPNPLLIVQLATNLLAPDGAIFIEVPDLERPNHANIADFFTIEHLTYFSLNTLETLAYQNGLRVTALETSCEKPAVRMIMKLSSEGKSSFVCNFYERNKHLAQEYKRKRHEFINAFKDKLQREDRDIIVYGAGLHTSQLFLSGLLKGKNVKKIIDSNPRKWGSYIEGIRVEGPDALREVTCPVLISSHDSQNEISCYLTKMFFNLRQINLYEDVPLGQKS